mgnify:FL=1
MINASQVEFDSLAEQVRSLLGSVDRLQAEVGQLRRENADLRKQVSQLRCDAGYWKSRHADALKRNELVKTDLEQAKGEIRLLRAEHFGKRSEKQWAVDRSGGSDDAKQPAKKNKRGQQPGRPAPKRRDYSHLPVRTYSVDLPEKDKACGDCGKPLESLGYREDGQQLEIKTIVYRRIVRRGRYRRTCQCERPQTVTAPQPPKLLSKSLLGRSVWTHLLIDKFHLQRPMHRTLKNLELLGLDLAAGTITDGFRQIAPLMTPIYEAIQARQARSKYLHADETRWKVFTEKTGKKGYRWWLWVFAGNGAVNFVLDPSRSHEVPQLHCPEKSGAILVVDRYSGYKAMEQVGNGKLRLAFCWAHVRRDFMRVGKSYQQLQRWSLQWLARIKHLYHLNRRRLQCRPGTKKLSKAEATLRKHVDSMAAERDAELSDSSLCQPCCKVLESLKGHWPGLTRFVQDSGIPLDNNYSERLIRNPVIGRKNYYGSGVEWSGQMAVTMFSIFATLETWKINPRTWLNDYIAACAQSGGIPQNPESFLPWKLSKKRLATLQRPTDEQDIDTS